MAGTDAKFEETGPDPEGDRVPRLPARGAPPGLPVVRRPRLRRVHLVPSRRGVFARLAVLVFDMAVLALLCLAIAVFALSGREVTAPPWLTERAMQQLDAGLPGARLRIDSLSVRFSAAAPPRLSFHGVRLSALDGDGDGADADGDLLRVPRVEIGLRRRALLTGRVQPDALRLSGAQVVLQRDATGRFDLGFGGEAWIAAPATIAELLDRIDSTFAQPALAPIRSVEADEITLLLRDARADRAWTIEDGRITLTQTPEELRIASAFSVPGSAPVGPGGQMTVPEAEVVFTALRGSAEGTLAARITGLPAADIAAQSPALAWLGPLRAPVSGALRATLAADGSLGAVSGKLEIGAGALHPRADLAPVPFDAARAYFTFQPDTARVQFDELRLRGPAVDFSGGGHAYLDMDPDNPSGLPRGLIAQIQSRDLRLDPQGVFDRAARFTSAAADLRIGFQPFRVEIGQLSLVPAAPDTLATDDMEADAPAPARLVASGDISAEDAGWRVALDGSVARITGAQALALWPLEAAPETRAWLRDNLRAATLQDLRAALRLSPGMPLRRQVTWRFSGTEVQPLRGFARITGASGFASLSGEGFNLTLEQGRIAAPGRGPVDLSGTVFQVLETGRQPVPVRLLLAAAAPIPDLLGVLDMAPLRLLRDVPQGPDLVEEGRARLQATLEWDLQPDVTLADMDLGAQAVLEDLRAETLVPGRQLRADRLVLRADNRLLTLSGRADLSGVDLEAVWSRPLGARARASPARLEGTVRLDDATLRALGIILPEGTVRGAGVADVVLILPRGEGAPAFTLTSDLNRVALSIPELGWSKPPAVTGLLRLSGTLGPVPAVPEIELRAPGLQARGALRFEGDGRFAALDLARLQVGGWLDAPVTLRGRGAGRAPGIVLRGGRIDVAGLPRGIGGGGGQGAPIRLEGTRLDLSPKVALTGLTGSLAPQGRGLTGSFSARVNGAAQVRGQLAPGAARGTALRLTAGDAGAALRAAGLFGRAQGGTLSLTLQPRPAAGEYDGQLAVANTRVTSATGLATLLNAMSIVGLLDQLSGPGILFSDIDARFRLTPRLLEVREGSGTGPSLGISMQGVYDMAADRLNMQGVVSPVYVLNGIGQIFTRRGEGVFGFNYRMTGPARAPQVTVNPLSVLTPGMFRELFRRPPPTISE